MSLDCTLKISTGSCLRYLMDWGQYLIEGIVFLVLSADRKQYRRGRLFFVKLIDAYLYLRLYDFILGHRCRFWNCTTTWAGRAHSHREGFR